ncbi:MAG: UDP-N-acetylglucosamine--LPS N-acetylglucosamine transferase [Acidobacteriia bacterium]|nr:UDP-N-acetylglucosamine--LPS N-acetylglucosamine transferase [Terriglobia bacterium]
MWLIYALGGGWGHLTRAVALARIAQPERPVRILTNSPYAGIVAGSLPDLDLVVLDARAPAAETRAAAMREIAEFRPSCLIVDTFPRGIGGELAGMLATLSARKVLVHRDLNPRYVAVARIRAFVAAHYDVVLVPGAGEGSQLGDLPIAFETGPWLVRCADEIPDLGQARELLRLAPHEEHCVLVCASGKKDELAWYGEVVSRLRELDRSVPVRSLAAERPPQCPDECWVRYWPAIDLFGAAAVVVGGAGYNTVQESLAWDVPLVLRPWPRAYDRQELRARRASAGGRVTLVQEPEEAARAALEQIEDRRVWLPRFANGAVEAVARIAGGT